MAKLGIDNGGGLTQCKTCDPKIHKTCDNYDGTPRGDKGKECFKFRDYGDNFWVCNNKDK